MRNIFTYPNNPFFIDPNYLGDDTAGFQRRIKDLKDGTYLPWGTATAPTQTVDEIMTAIGKYYNYYDTTGGTNITRHDMWDYPLVEHNLEEIPGRDPISFEIVSSYPTLNSNNKPFAVYRFTTATPHGFTTGDLVVAPSGNEVPKTGAAGSLAEAYVKAVSDTVFELYGNAACTESQGTNDWIPTQNSSDEVYIWNNEPSTSNVYGAPQMGLQMPNGTSLLSDGDAIRRTEDLDNSNWTGDGANNVVRFVDVVDANHVNLYEDQALTTPLTVTPEFVANNNIINGSQGFGYGTGPQQLILEDIQYVGDQSTRFQALACFNQSGEKRIKGYVTVYSEDTTGDLGPLVFSSVSPGVAISPDEIYTTSTYKAPRYQKPIWIELNHQPAPNTHSTTNFTLYDSETGGNILEFSARSGNGPATNQTAYWNVHVIEPALNQSPNTCTVDEHTWFKYEDGTTAGGDEFWPFWRNIEWNVSGNYAMHRYQAPNIVIHGTRRFTYQDSSNVTQPGAEFSNYIALPGEYPYTLRTAVQGTEVEAAVFTINLKAGPSQLETITTTGGIYDSPTNTQFQNRINPLASQYVPPGPTPVQTAAAEDNFDLNDIWYTNTTSYDPPRTKNWPREIVPASAELTESQPSITTNSQAGIKYVRSGGFSKTGVSLSYPLLTEEKFRVLQNASQLARGQTAVFRWYWVNTTFTNHWIWKLNYSSNTDPYVVSGRDNDRVWLLEGFESNESEVLKEGQLVIMGGSYNGDASQNVATVDANVFGEVESRLSYKPSNYLPSLGSQAWLVPDNITVTLAEDDFVYTARADGLYDVSVKFDFGWYHSS